MIRPLTNEDELQNLGEMELEELRAEFVEQVMHLRRKVINKIKPKQIGTTMMDGSIWIALVEQYVEAFNQGGIPNIQSSWTYICRQKAAKEVEQCKAIFEEELQQSVQIPSNCEELDQFLRQEKENCILSFQKKSKGEPEITEEYCLELTAYLDKRINEVSHINAQECRNHATDLLNNLFSEFDQ